VGGEEPRPQVLIGEIKWFGRWRQYAFFPATACVFSEGCMTEIATFIREQMSTRKGQRVLRAITALTTGGKM
jgi:hypothetical protein